MMHISRRRLADYAVKQLLEGQTAKQISKELAAVLIETKKTGDAELLAQDIAWQLEKRGKLASVEVTSATGISETLRQEITSFIKEAVGVKQVNINEETDESVIGGVRIETAALAWDRTIAKQLTDIKESF
jgi:F0F1-type ATP synthase delta subunit